MFLQQFALVVFASAAATGGAVLVVDAAAGPFLDIQSAVDAAIDGDVVLVRAGSYPSFSVIARDVAVVADTGAIVEVQGAIRARDIGVGQTLVLSGLRAHGTLSNSVETNGLRATGCAGVLRIQDCQFTGGDGPACVDAPPGGMPAGARIRSCNDVAIARSVLLGGRIPGGYFSSQPTDAGGPGLEIEQSRVALQAVEARGPSGGNGTSASCPDGSTGGTGAFVRSGSELDAQRCAFLGGHGGSSANVPPFSYGGDGGSGLSLFPACPSSSIARTLASTLQSGGGGNGFCSAFCGGETFDGWSGLPSWASSCTSIVPLVGMSPHVQCAAVVREGTTLSLSMSGTAGSELWLRTSRTPVHTWNAGLNGALLVEANTPARWSSVGTLDGLGHATYALPIAALPPGTQARVMYLQLMSTAPDGTSQLGTACTVVVVDSAI